MPPIPRSAVQPRPPKPITPQKVRAVLSEAGFPPCVRPPTAYEKGQDGWIVWWAEDEDGNELRSMIEVRHSIFCRIRAWESIPEWAFTRPIARYAAALSAAGIPAEVRDGAVWVSVDGAGKTAEEDR